MIVRSELFNISVTFAEVGSESCYRGSDPESVNLNPGPQPWVLSIFNFRDNTILLPKEHVFRQICLSQRNVDGSNYHLSTKSGLLSFGILQCFYKDLS